LFSFGDTNFGFLLGHLLKVIVIVIYLLDMREFHIVNFRQQHIALFFRVLQGFLGFFQVFQILVEWTAKFIQFSTKSGCIASYFLTITIAVAAIAILVGLISILIDFHIDRMRLGLLEYIRAEDL